MCGEISREAASREISTDLAFSHSSFSFLVKHLIIMDNLKEEIDQFLHASQSTSGAFTVLWQKISREEDTLKNYKSMVLFHYFISCTKQNREIGRLLVASWNI